MLGLSLAYLPKDSLSEAAEAFFELQSEFPLRACEVHMEAVQFASAFWYWDRSADAAVASIRERVETLVVHLPYLDMNPISPNPRLARIALAAQRSAIARSASLGADSAVFHARGQHGLNASRARELECWRTVVTSLTDAAERHRLTLCFENADDVRLISEMEWVLDADPRMRACLDLGHLFERIDPGRAVVRMACRLTDSYLPGFTVRRGVPYYEAGDLSRLIGDRVRCVHVHNHDGRTAHRPISDGKADIPRIIRSLGDLDEIPVILEADYRQSDLRKVKADIESLVRSLE